MGGQQNVSLDNGCIRRGTATHELLHRSLFLVPFPHARREKGVPGSLGFFHEQSRADRDAWVRINWANLAGWIVGFPRELQSSEIKSQFAKYDWAEMAELSVGWTPFTFLTSILLLAQHGLVDSYDYGSILHYSPFAYS